jgi:hypothetical protein
VPSQREPVPGAAQPNLKYAEESGHYQLKWPAKWFSEPRQPLLLLAVVQIRLLGDYSAGGEMEHWRIAE